MARNKKNAKKEIGEGSGEIITLRLDKRAKHIWNLAVKHGNMSEWIRQQLEYHFGSGVPLDVAEKIIKEEIFILQKELEKKINSIEATYEQKIGKKRRQLEKIIQL